MRGYRGAVAGRSAFSARAEAIVPDNDLVTNDPSACSTDMGEEHRRRVDSRGSHHAWSGVSGDQQGRGYLGTGMSAEVLWDVVCAAPHDVRRACARLSRLAGGEPDQRGMVEAAGVGLPRLSKSRMISRRRWAQSARNDRKPWCRDKTGTGNPPASARFKHHPLNVGVLTCRTGQRSNAGEEARSSRTAALGQLHRSTHPRKVVFMRTRSGISPIGISRLDQRPSAPFSQPGASVTWSQCSVNFPSFTRTVSNANAS